MASAAPVEGGGGCEGDLVAEIPLSDSDCSCARASTLDDKVTRQADNSSIFEPVSCSFLLTTITLDLVEGQL